MLGNGFVGHSFLAAEPEDSLLLLCQLCKSPVNQLLTFPGIQFLFYAICRFGYICPYLIQELLLAGDFPQVVQGFVPGYHEDIVANVVYVRELFAAGPEFKKGFLQEILCIYCRMGKMEYKGRYRPA